MATSKSSRRWLDRHVNDPYVQRAQREGYRSRAAYKLLELDAKDRLLRRGQTVVDLGAAPGGWSQVAARLVAAGTPGPPAALPTPDGGAAAASPPRIGGRVIALDLLPMAPLDGVEFLQGDFRDEADFGRLTALLGGAPVDLVLSDMAPNSTGMQAVDQPRAMFLVELAAGFAQRVLKPGGALVVKSFQGAGFDELVRALRGDFERVATRKPAASRSDSREVYLVARGRRVG